MIEVVVIESELVLFLIILVCGIDRFKIIVLIKRCLGVIDKWEIVLIIVCFVVL